MKFIQFLLIAEKGITDYYLKIKQIIKSEPFPYHMQLPTNRKSWTSQEDQTIKLLVSIYGIEDWTQISNKLAEQYPQAKRSGKQCRQRWYNHLSPVISKNPWTLDEENKLFRLHREQGNKWKDISKEFVGRTDNDLKNHFYSTLRKSLRRLNKSLGEKNSTSQMRQIKPSVLSKIMNHIYDGENKSNLLDSLKDVPSLIFEFANIKPTKSGLTLKDDEMRDKVLKIFCLITMFNDQYEKGKHNRKERGSGKKEKAQKTSRSKVQEKKQNQWLMQNDIEPSDSTLSNQLDSMLDSDNFELKHDAFQDNTEASMASSSYANQPFSHMSCDPDSHHDSFNFMFRPNTTGIFDDHDQILEAQFGDPQQPSVINDYVFNEAIVGKSIFQRFVQHETYCTKFVDELLDVHYK